MEAKINEAKLRSFSRTKETMSRIKRHWVEIFSHHSFFLKTPKGHIYTTQVPNNNQQKKMEEPMSTWYLQELGEGKG